MATCKHCESWVTDDWARVYEDERGRLWFCPECAPLHGGAEPGDLIKERREQHGVA